MLSQSLRLYGTVLSGVLFDAIFENGRVGLLFLFKVFAVFFETILLGVCVYYVSVSVLQLEGAERFPLILTSVAVVRWTLDAILGGHLAAPRLDVYRDICKVPVFLAFVESQLVSTLAWVSALLAIGLVSRIMLDGVGNFLLLSFLFVAGFHLIINFGVWASSLLIRRYAPFYSPIFLIVLLLLLAILSPIFFLLRDLPVAPGLVVTSLNPMSHLLAGYHNTLWYGQTPSFEVLPWMAAAALAFGWSIRSLLSNGGGIGDGPMRLRNWRPRPTDLSVRKLATLVVRGKSWLGNSDEPARSNREVAIDVQRTLAGAGFDELLHQPISVLTDSKMALLVMLSALKSGMDVRVDESLRTLLRDEDLAIYKAKRKQGANNGDI